MFKKEITLVSKHNNRKFLADTRCVEDHIRKPVIILNHGFKGFKDWGPFNLVADFFAQQGFVFVKMNFSHNGITLENPSEFADLQAFSMNNFSIELDDTGVLIDYLFSGDCIIPEGEMNLDRLFIIGHSRGGASAILKAREDIRIKGVVTWAAVDDLEDWHTKEELAYWKKVKTIYIHNARTGQEMPMNYQIVEDFNKNRSRLTVPDAVSELKIPMKAFHGKKDQTVSCVAIENFQSRNPEMVETELLENADHTFGGTHPFTGNALPEAMAYLLKRSVEFINQIP
jgi:dienelactone hydrolase